MEQTAELRANIISKVIKDAGLSPLIVAVIKSKAKITNKLIRDYCNIEGMSDVNKIILERNVKIIMGKI